MPRLGPHSGTKKPRRKPRRGLMLRSAPEWIRTTDLRLRRPTLYPAELRARCARQRGRRNKPSSVSARAEGIISLGPALPTASCSLPGTVKPKLRGAGRTSSLHGLAPGGVCRATSVASRAVRSYRTLSPLPVLPREPSAVCSLLHFPSPFGARALPGTLPCGARTFLDTRRCRDPHSPPTEVVNHAQERTRTSTPVKAPDP